MNKDEVKKILKEVNETIDRLFQEDNDIQLSFQSVLLCMILIEVRKNNNARQ